MMFAPTTERSLGVRSLYASLYILLSLGAITMIVPFLIMFSGSFEPRAEGAESTLFPTYVLDREALWERYVETKYHADERYLQMAYNQPGLTFQQIRPELSAENDLEMLGLWNQFLEEANPPDELFAVGFLRRSPRMPASNGFRFTDWLIKRYGSLEAINTAVSGDFTRVTRIRPPLIRMDGAPLARTPLVNNFLEFSQVIPATQKFAWNVGGYYRAEILPRMISVDVTSFNEQFGTNHQSYDEVPFPPTVPEIGAEPWFFYVSQLLRPDFIEFTPEGMLRFEASGMGKADFIRSEALPQDVRVVSLDTMFDEWAAGRGVGPVRIPQATMDRLAFAEEAGFWKKEYLTINYRYVAAEILVHGRAIMNTIILVVLSVVGALIVNPLAAYALSRYKMRKAFHILLFFLATIAFPGEVTMIPVFLQLKELGMLNTFGALVLPGLASGFSIFLLKGFFDSLPRELYEAAELDGASEFVTFWNITMNLSKPILAVIALSTFVSAYGTFFYALILAPDPRMWTVMVYVFQLRMSVDPPVVYAALILTAIPTLIIFLTCQNIILRGIVVPSDK
jgi:multiple sugar transport system permease protein